MCSEMLAHVDTTNAEIYGSSSSTGEMIRKSIIEDERVIIYGDIFDGSCRNRT
jgi:hypothetical protein